MNLVIDIGNTRSKFAVFDNENLIDSKNVSNIASVTIREIRSQFVNIKRCVISTVKSDLTEITDTLRQLDISFLLLDHSLNLPFRNQYSTPKTLGNDRLAAVAGAHALYPDKDILIIDAGTAITFDMLTTEHGYIGGNISPGLEMRYKALNKYTDQIPLQSKEEEHDLLGHSTSEAITSGVQNGLIFEIEGYLTKIGKEYPQMTVLLTGGDAQFFDNKLKRPIFVVPNLTLIGLNIILNYNAQAY